MCTHTEKGYNEKQTPRLKISIFLSHSTVEIVTFIVLKVTHCQFNMTPRNGYLTHHYYLSSTIFLMTMFAKSTYDCYISNKIKGTEQRSQQINPLSFVSDLENSMRKNE